MGQHRKLHDRYFKRAKREGYLARSAYKLLEIQRRRTVLRRGDRVLDLGCYPGSWLQVAAEIVGSRGAVVGIDLEETDADLGPNVVAARGDFTTTSAPELLAMLNQETAGDESPARFDAVLSDMAPSTTGHGDHFFSERLCQTILDALPDLLKRRGTLVMKVLEGETFPDLLARTRSMFREAGALKPDACRDVSRETYIVALGYDPGRARTDGPTDDPIGGQTDGSTDEPTPTAKPMPKPKPGWGS